MGTNIVFFAWNRPIPGREQISSEHFNEFTAYLTGLPQSGAIDSFEPAFLEPHGGDLNGFFLIRADTARLDAMMANKEWVTHIARASSHLEGTGTLRGVTGEALMERMGIWRDAIPT